MSEIANTKSSNKESFSDDENDLSYSISDSDSIQEEEPIIEENEKQPSILLDVYFPNNENEEEEEEETSTAHSPNNRSELFPNRWKDQNNLRISPIDDLPDYKPKNIGSGFSSSSSDEEKPNNENKENCNDDIEYSLSSEDVDEDARDESSLLEKENTRLKEEIEKIKKENEVLKNQITIQKPEDIFDKFSLVDMECKKIRKICTTSISKVFEMVDTLSGLHFAKKSIFKEHLDFNGIKQFMKEFELLRYIKHPSVVNVYGFSISDENSFSSIYFEYLPITLNQAMQTSLFTNTLKTKVVIEICSGLDYIHDCGIIHCDIKDENILLSDGLCSKIIDFGTAQFQNPSTHKGNVGTPFFMSPEMASDKDFDKSTDVYSFGILLFYILTGSLPQIQINEKIEGKQPHIPEKISKLGKEIINKCTSFSPQDRPTFNEILQMIKENDFQLFDNIEIDFIKKRYEELILFKSLYPPKMIEI